MTKNQKLWFWVGAALFAIPEILWSPVLGLFPWNKSFTASADNHLLLTVVVLVETLGLLGIAVVLFMQGRYYIKMFALILLCLAIWSFYIFYLLFATLHVWS